MTEIQNYYEQNAISGTTKSIAILLHGLGSNGQDLISLSPYLGRGLPETTFISPDAPFACDMAPPDYPNSYQWFSLQDRDPQAMLRGAQETAPILENFITAQIEKYDVEPENCALVGFSQGTMMSLYVAPRYNAALAGVLGYSGALLWEEGFEPAHKPPICLVHGENDDVVPIDAYNMARGKLIGEGFKVSGHSCPSLAHSIDESGIKTGSEFLQLILTRV